MNTQNNNQNGTKQVTYDDIKTQDSPLVLIKDINTIKTTPKPKPKK